MKKILLLFITVLLLAPQGVNAEILYERDLSSEEKERYELYFWNQILESDKSRDEHAEELRALEWKSDWRTVKVELLEEETSGKPMARYTNLGRDLIRDKKEQNWMDSAPSRLQSGVKDITLDGLDADPITFTFKEQEARFAGNPLGIYDPRSEYIGMYIERFESETGESLELSVYETLGSNLNSHEVLRFLLPFKTEPKKLDFGTVITFSENVSEHDKNTPQKRGLAWMSDNKRAVYISSTNIDPTIFAKKYGEKFGSSLPEELYLDRIGWAQKDAAQNLQRLYAALHVEQSSPIDWFSFYLSRLNNHIFFPFDVIEPGYTGGRDIRAALYEEISSWWSENNTNIYWDHEIGKFVANGYSPSELLEKARKEEEHQRKALLNIPISDDDIAKLIMNLINQIKEGKQEEIILLKDAFSKQKDKVTLEMGSNNKLVIMHPSPNGKNIVTKTYFEPEIIIGESKEVPLIATQKIEILRYGEKNMAEELYSYMKVEGMWVLGSVQPNKQ